MLIKHYEINQPAITVGKEWKSCWYGLARLNECYAEKAWQVFKDTEKKAHSIGCLGERELEVDLFLSIMAEIKNKEMIFVELGAGYADWCLAVNGVIRNKLIDTKVKKAFCYAVEAEPQHIKWIIRHFKQWSICGEVVPCIISDKNEECKFSVDADPSSNYGQSVTYTDSILRTVGNLLRRKSVMVYSLTIDFLVSMYKIPYIDYIDMDVQGSETNVIRGAMNTIKDGRIDYIKIGTHGAKYHKQLKELLSPYYELIVDILPFSIGGINGLKAQVQDGIQLYKRKGV